MANRTTRRPDWVALWGDPESALSPWQAYWLASSAESISFNVSDFVFADEDVVFDNIAGWCSFPAIVEPFLAGLDIDRRMSWITAYLAELERIVESLQAGDIPWPANVGAEIALRAALGTATAIADDDSCDDKDCPREAVTARDRDLGFLNELLFDDDDVLLLFNPDIVDVVIDPAGEWAITMCAPNLHPARWFIRFADGLDSVTVDVDDDTALVAAAQSCLDRHVGAGQAVATAVGERSDCSVSVSVSMAGLRDNVRLQVDFEHDATGDGGGEVTAQVTAVASADSGSIGIVVVDRWSLFGFADLVEFVPVPSDPGDIRRRQARRPRRG